MHLSGGWLTCWQLSWNSVMAILAFWFWPLVQAPTNHTCSWHLCVPGHFRDGPAAFAIASPHGRPRFLSEGIFKNKYAEVLLFHMQHLDSPCHHLDVGHKKKVPNLQIRAMEALVPGANWDWEKWRLGNWDHIFYKLNLQNCRVFKLQLVSLLSPFRSSCRRKEWESGG